MTNEGPLDITRIRQNPVWAYDAETVELAFLCWIEADRNVPRAMRRFDEVANGMKNPDRVTWHAWVKQNDWSAKADEAVISAFPNIHRRQLARLVILADRALDTIAAVDAGDFDHLRPHALRARVDIAKLVTDLACLRGGTDQVTAHAQDQDRVALPDGTDPAERQRDRLQRARELRERQREGR